MLCKSSWSKNQHCSWHTLSVHFPCKYCGPHFLVPVHSGSSAPEEVDYTSYRQCSWPLQMLFCQVCYISVTLTLAIIDFFEIYIFSSIKFILWTSQIKTLDLPSTETRRLRTYQFLRGLRSFDLGRRWFHRRLFRLTVGRFSVLHSEDHEILL